MVRKLEMLFFNLSAKVRIRNWTALDRLPADGSPWLNVALLTLQHSLEEAAFGNCLTSSCWEAVSFFTLLRYAG